ncbi:serine/arginine-rich splicing factor SC35 [Selaginella moellendorffii]|uniref:serine/arginine-rich splicing factor SC35 n=1 Tax=Selaginella moellendorffii TaxID=88036 RepID=UPI000D1C53B0|nr:serine/arginine-rich splicing factor SC35 [Selaginella moellendorffii]|eukprot:XP_024522417.1 serine/arginine-rich splicing factor SC35 [Selaginella moellendorffii]
MSHFGRAGPPDIRDTYSLLVLNITFRTTADDLYPLFDRYGKVVDIFIPRDRRSGESRGFAFVRYKHVDEAQKAIDRLDGKNLNGRNIMVQFAKYDKNSESTYCGRITTSICSRSRSRSPRRPSRYREEYGRGRDYRDNFRGRDRYEHERSRDDHFYEHDRMRDRYERRDRHERDYRHQHERSRDSHDVGRTKERYERDRFDAEVGRGGRSRSRSRDRYAEDDHREARGRPVERTNSSPAPLSPAPARLSSPVRETALGSPRPVTTANRDASPLEQARKSERSPVRSLSPEKSYSNGKREASPGPVSPAGIGVDIQSPYNTDPDES